MAGRRSSGLFETIIKSTLGFGTTVHHKSDWLGRRQTVVKHHGSGKKKTYTHGAGFFGNITKTKTEKRGRIVEQGTLKKRFWGGADEHVKRDDGTKIERKYRPAFFFKRVTTIITGQCWTCNGTGTFQPTGKPCRKCEGSGRFSKTKHE
jgi:hypothetical protein